MKEIDFLPKWYKKGRRRQISYRTQYIALGGVFAVMIVWNFITVHSISKAAAELVNAESKQAEAESVSREFAKIKNEVKRFQKKVNILQEIDFVEIVKKGSNKFINPKVPYFEDFYNTLGRYAKEEKKFDERELISLEILDRLSSSPHRKEALYLTDDKKLIDWVIDIGKKGSYMDTIESQNIVYSPIYFMDFCSVVK